MFKTLLAMVTSLALTGCGQDERFENQRMQNDETGVEGDKSQESVLDENSDRDFTYSELQCVTVMIATASGQLLCYENNGCCNMPTAEDIAAMPVEGSVTISRPRRFAAEFGLAGSLNARSTAYKVVSGMSLVASKSTDSANLEQMAKWNTTYNKYCLNGSKARADSLASYGGDFYGQ